jgi:hypothetical protein
MRRLAIGVCALLPLALVLLTASCSRQDVLRVTSINRGLPIKADIADFATWTDPSDPAATPEYYYVIPEEPVEVEFQYVEMGVGLPTWTPYQVIINKAVVAFKGAADYNNLTVPLNVTVVADREGKKTVKTSMVLATAAWKELNFGDDVSEPPDYGMIDNIDATVTFTGVDSISGRTVTASGKVLIEIGNLYDDDGSIGQ